MLGRSEHLSEEDRLKTEEMKEKLENGMLSDADLEEQVSREVGPCHKLGSNKNRSVLCTNVADKGKKAL